MTNSSARPETVYQSFAACYQSSEVIEKSVTLLPIAMSERLKITRNMGEMKRMFNGMNMSGASGSKSFKVLSITPIPAPVGKLEFDVSLLFSEDKDDTRYTVRAFVKPDFINYIDISYYRQTENRHVYRKFWSALIGIIDLRIREYLMSRIDFDYEM